MKEEFSDVVLMRRAVFKQVARLAYEDGDLHDLRRAVYDILPGEEPRFRDNIFRERAITGERLRLALGLNVRTAADMAPLDENIDLVDVSHRVYEPPLVNVISFACQACPTKEVKVTNMCRACIGHPCKNVCPKQAIEWNSKDGALINQDLCIRCGRCVGACPYNAIIAYDRPCAANCGVKAIGNDEYGRAKINYDLCVSCGRCITECPFGAISDKGQLYQLIRSIRRGEHHVAIVAPSFVGQFGTNVRPEQVFEAIRQLGFTEVMEVGLGADLTTLHEAEEFVHLVPEERPFMGTSCCNSWSLMVEKMFPEFAPYISETATPMIEIAYYIKRCNPDAHVTFIGPCISKKLEALRPYVQEYVDFVITYEELMAAFEAKELDLESIEAPAPLNDASKTARGYAASAGVASAVEALIKEKWPDVEVKYESAEGLDNCIKLMRAAKAGRKDGMLLEGMACEGGCIGGPGTLVTLARARKALTQFMNESEFTSPQNNERLNTPNEDCVQLNKETIEAQRALEEKVSAAAQADKDAYLNRNHPVD